MSELVKSIKHALAQREDLPFSVYTSIKEQYIVNVPLVKPTLIFVLSGQKKLGRDGAESCSRGEFVFFGDGVGIDMRNIPGDSEYFALLIEFDYEDFTELKTDINSDFVNKASGESQYLIGTTTENLALLLEQLIQWSLWAPPEMWSLRRREILRMIYYMGYSNVATMAGQASLSRNVYQLIRAGIGADVSSQNICDSLAMSESTLRRKLKLEHTNFQNLKDDVTLGQGLHLLQSTRHPIGYIATECGYQSQSRFSQRFKQKFGLTPSELRKTRG